MRVCASLCDSMRVYASVSELVQAKKYALGVFSVGQKKILGLHDLVRNQVGQVELVMSMARLNLVKI